jgi:hypothetical protein
LIAVCRFWSFEDPSFSEFFNLKSGFIENWGQLITDRNFACADLERRRRGVFYTGPQAETENSESGYGVCKILDKRYSISKLNIRPI